MPCIFVRTFPADRSERECLPEWTSGCEWVRDGEGVATRKFDGTACSILGGRLFARYDAKRGKMPPAGAVPCDPSPDPVTGHWPHWVSVEQQPEFKWHREAMQDGLPDGTYELVGPYINANKDARYVAAHQPRGLIGITLNPGRAMHILVRHGEVTYNDAPRDHSGLKEYLSRLDAEGIVFHHPDGRMAKIRRVDFLLGWPT